MLIVDNGSTDGTLELLCHLAGALPITVVSDPDSFRQPEIVTRMAQQAARDGADWVLPIDADEFWAVADGNPLKSRLQDVPSDIGVLSCEVVNFAQERSIEFATPDSLLRASRRVVPGGPSDRSEELVTSGEIAFIEIEYPRKCIIRADTRMQIGRGNHSVTGVPGGVLTTDEVTCLHIPLRARSALTAKIDQGRRLEEAGVPGDSGWHVRRWWRMAREGTLDDEWAANSYEDDALLLESGQLHRVVPDSRLVTLIEPWIKSGLPANAPPWIRFAPPVGAYLLALDSVPGWFSEVDFRIFLAIDELQKVRGTVGNLFEIGGYCGKTSILLAWMLAAGERSTVCDLFNENKRVSESNREENCRWYTGFTRHDFEHHYLRFHRDLPEVLACSSTEIDRDALRSTCRLVHIDGSHVHAVVAQDIETARALLRSGGVVAMDDISTQHNPGSALAAWEAVSNGTFRPICLTDAKLYATFQEDDGLFASELESWARNQPDLSVEVHELAGWKVPRIFARPADPGKVAIRASRLSSLEPVGAFPEAGHDIAANESVAQPVSPYDERFYDTVKTSARSSAEVIVPIILKLLAPKSVVDIGCGTGTWLSVFSDLGVDDIVGVDGRHVDQRSLDIPRSAFREWDLEDPLPLTRRFDLAVCLEVAEHLRSERAETLIDELTGLAPTVFFSAAVRLQGGVGHVNEQWQSYWVEKFANRGFVVVDAIRPSVWDDERVAMWYSQNSLIFANQESLAEHPALMASRTPSLALPIDVVHPSLFLYYRLSMSGPVARVPLDAASTELSPTTAITGPSPVECAGAPPVGLRALLKALLPAARRAVKARLAKLDRRVRRGL